MCGKKPKKSPKKSTGTNNPSQSVADASKGPNQNVLPVLPPRQHGPGCAVEIALLEKHSEHCKHRKLDNPARNPTDDTFGSYFVVGRVTYQMCARPCSAQKGAKPYKGGANATKHQVSNSASMQSGAQFPPQSARYPNCPCPNPPKPVYAMFEMLGGFQQEYEGRRRHKKSHR